MKVTCKEYGHIWQWTTSYGWFLCNRKYCHAIAHCPGCLGSRLLGKTVVLCSSHEHIDICSLSVVRSSQQEEKVSSSETQQSMLF